MLLVGNTTHAAPVGAVEEQERPGEADRKAQIKETVWPFFDCLPRNNKSILEAPHGISQSSRCFTLFMHDSPSKRAENPHDHLCEHVKSVFTADALHMLCNRDSSMEKLGVLLISGPSPIIRTCALIGELHCYIKPNY